MSATAAVFLELRATIGSYCSTQMFYRWTRDLHLYTGLFVSPFVLVFAASVLFLNHAKVDTTVATATETLDHLTIPAGVENARGREAVELARAIVEEVGVSGEIGVVRTIRNERRIVIPVSKPGLETIVEVDITARSARVSRRRTSALESTAYLHKSPGPHNADLRGNWLWTRVWRYLADGTVYLLLFVSATGLYLWFAIRAARRTGIVLLTVGTLTFVTFLYGIAF